MTCAEVGSRKWSSSTDTPSSHAANLARKDSGMQTRAPPKVDVLAQEMLGEREREREEQAKTTRRVGRFLVTAKDDLVLVDGPVAFFRAPSPVKSIDCARDKIGIGCENGAVLHLCAEWLTSAA